MKGQDCKQRNSEIAPKSLGPVLMAVKKTS